MKNNISLKLCFLFPLIASSTINAATIDYRHEYLNDTEVNADRIRVSARFANQVGFALEGKWGSKSGFLQNNYSKGQEFELNYYYKVDDRLSLTPAVVIDSSSESTTYKMQVKGIYLVTAKFYTGARYRYGLQNYTSPSTDNRHFHQGNFYLGYKFDWGNVEYDFEYKNTDYASLRGNKYTYLQNLVIQYPINKAWIPFIELGYVPYRNNDKGGYIYAGQKYANDFQVRYRAGIKYNF